MSRVLIEIAIPSGHGDALADLRDALAEEQELRGLVTGEQPAIGQDQLGTLTEILLTVAAPSAAATVLAEGVVVWLRTRTSDVTVRLRRADGTEVDVTGARLRRMSHRELPALTAELTAWLTEQPAAPPTPEDPEEPEPTVRGD